VKKILAAVLFTVSSSLAFAETPAAAFSLDGTGFDDAAELYQLDPVLLYSVALAESASGRGDGNVAPWPWTLRTLTKPFYGLSKSDAITQLDGIIADRGPNVSVDIGFMQINWFWHGYRVGKASDLLDPKINLETGAQILSETIKSAPGDLELGIGRYHQWKDEEVSRAYGARVLSIYGQLKSLQGDSYAALTY
jgi:hypothetical protein